MSAWVLDWVLDCDDGSYINVVVDKEDADWVLDWVLDCDDGSDVNVAVDEEDGYWVFCL